MCNKHDCPHGFCDPMTNMCMPMPYKKGISGKEYSYQIIFLNF